MLLGARKEGESGEADRHEGQTRESLHVRGVPGKEVSCTRSAARGVGSRSAAFHGRTGSRRLAAPRVVRLSCVSGSAQRTKGLPKGHFSRALPLAELRRDPRFKAR